MTKERLAMGLVCATSWLAACDGGAPATRGSDLQASAIARSHGVDRYRLEGSAVALIGSDGATLGHLSVTTPSAETRLVEIFYADGRRYEDEVTRPLDGRFLAPVDDDQAGAIQADPALASYFQGRQLVFTLAPARDAAANLAPSEIAFCIDVPFAPECSLCTGTNSCTKLYDYYSGGIHYTKKQARAACPVVECTGGGWAADIVAKNRACQDPGSCTNQALGMMNCSTDGDC